LVLFYYQNGVDLNLFKKDENKKAYNLLYYFNDKFTMSVKPVISTILYQNIYGKMNAFVAVDETSIKLGEQSVPKVITNAWNYILDNQVENVITFDKSSALWNNICVTTTIVKTDFYVIKEHKVNSKLYIYQINSNGYDNSMLSINFKVTLKRMFDTINPPYLDFCKHVFNKELGNPFFKDG
jgi:hypothetical protein